MSAGRILLAVALGLALSPAGRTQSCNLAEAVGAGDCFRIQLETRLLGDMRFQKASGTVSLKQEMTARHEYPERVLQVAAAGPVQKTARVYETAQASFRIGEDRFDKTLRGDRKLLVAQHKDDQLTVYSPAGALTRSELQLVGDHFNTLALPQLLPGKEVSAGDTWKVQAAVAQALCNFEGLTEQDLTGKLESIQDGLAHFAVTGKVTGIDTGALVKAAIEARGRYDVKARRIVALEWKQKDEREQGPVSPATATETTITLSRAAIAQPQSLSDVALVSVPEGLTVPPTLLQLDYHDPQGRFSLLHGREWQIVSESKEHLVLRLMDRGDFVAQATLTPWINAGKGKHLSAEEFKSKMNESAGWQAEQELQAGEVQGQEGRWVYRLSELGKMEDLAVLQNFYLVAAPGGEQVVVAFTMTPKQADKLGARDLSLIGGLEVPAAVK
jgi:hypothetical protein